MNLLTLNNLKNSTITNLLLVATFVLLSDAANQNDSYTLDSDQHKQSSVNTTTMALSETKITSTVRPWPSHNFFKNVLAQPYQIHPKVGHPQNTRSHNQKSKTTYTRQGEKLGHHNNISIYKTETLKTNETVYKGGDKVTDILIPNQMNTNSLVNKTISISKRVSSKAIAHLATPKTTGVAIHNSGTSENKTKPDQDISQTTNSFQLLTTKSKFKLTGSSKATVDPQREHVPTITMKTVTGSLIKPKSPLPMESFQVQNIDIKGSTRTMPIYKNAKQTSKSLNNQAILPFTVTRKKIQTKQIVRNSSQPQILTKIASVHNIKDYENGSQNKYKIHRNKVKRNGTDDTKDDTDSMLEWIEQENELSISPSANFSNFTTLKRPYKNQIKKTLLKNETERITHSSKISKNKPEASGPGVGFQYEFTIPSTPSTTEASLASNKLFPVPEKKSWKRVATITPYTVTKSKGNQNHSLSTNHWGSSGSMAKPVRVRTQTSIPVSPVENEVTTSKPAFDPTELTSHVAHQISISGSGIKTIPGKQLTNIWYKPIINHFTTSPTQHFVDSATSATSGHPLVFKVWSYKNGTLQLENEKEIPAWAINGFKIKDGSVLNIEQIPQALQTLVSSAIMKKKNNIVKEKRRPQKNLQKHSDLEDDNDDFANKEEIAPPSVSDHKRPLNVNYVIWKTDSSSHPPPLTDDSSTQSALQQTVTTPNPQFETSTVATISPIVTNYLNQYLHFLTTMKPLTITKAPDTEKDSWTKLEKLIFQSLAKATPIEHISEAHPQDSAASKKTDDQELLSNLAAVAILISYMKSQAPQIQTVTSTVTPIHPPSSSLSPPNDFNTAMFQLFQQLLQKKDPAESSQRVKVGEGVTIGSQEHESSYSKKPYVKDSPERLTKTLLLKGMVKKGKKKKKKKKKKLRRRRFKKKKKAFLHSLAHIFKKPKSYWFDMKFDIDFHDLLKKKFLYILAFKYAPVFFVLALSLVPLGIVIIPLLYKILWLKKKPRYIRVPVPYPKPYPVYPYNPHHYQPYDHDLQHAADSTGTSDYMHKTDIRLIPTFATPAYDNFPSHTQDIQQDTGGITDPEMTSANLEDYQKLQKGSSLLKPHAVNNAYDLGFDLGSKLGSITNTHDKEVLQILIENKKNKINKLLEKWKLLHKGEYTSPLYSLDAFEKDYMTKSKKRRKRKSY